MNVFIDTNVFLSFFFLDEHELDELSKFSGLVGSKVRLLLPEQVLDEFERNRESVIAQALDPLADEIPDLSIPNICSTYDQSDQLEALHRQYADTRSTLVAAVRADGTAKKLKADGVIYDMFRRAERIASGAELIDQARIRMQVGNPPGKQGSYGDAINWECLLSAVPQGQDIHLVSGDGDYRSLLDPELLKSFLSDEWRKRKESEIRYYDSLGLFLGDHFPHIALSGEREKDALAQQEEPD